MGRLSKRQKKKIHYYLRSKTDLKQKQDMLHRDGTPKFLERHLPYVRKLARNIDQLVIAASFISPPLKTGLIDRFLILAEIEDIRPIVVLNKTDLLQDKTRANEIFNMYERLGYHTILTSAKSGQGLNELDRELRGARSALTGHSGVGKSSLLNAVAPDLQLRVNEVSETTRKGKHTTSRVKIYKLDESTEVIDLPGIKIVDFIDVHRSEARNYFPEFEEYASDCKFADCLHISEPQCAVKKAVEERLIHPLRYRSYLNFVESLS